MPSQADGEPPHVSPAPPGSSECARSCDVEALLAHAEVDVEHGRHGDLERQDERVRDQAGDALREEDHRRRCRSSPTMPSDDELDRERHDAREQERPGRARRAHGQKRPRTSARERRERRAAAQVLAQQHRDRDRPGDREIDAGDDEQQRGRRGSRARRAARPRSPSRRAAGRSAATRRGRPAARGRRPRPGGRRPRSRGTTRSALTTSTSNWSSSERARRRARAVAHLPLGDARPCRRAPPAAPRRRPRSSTARSRGAGRRRTPRRGSRRPRAAAGRARCSPTSL